MLKQENLAENVVFAQGSPMLGEDVVLEGFTEGTQESSCTPQEEAQMLEEAVQAAAGAKKVILCIGEDRLQSGEATSNANIQIPEIQQKLLDRVAEVNDNIVVVLFSGRPLDIRDIKAKAKAILEARHRGSRSDRRCSVWCIQSDRKTANELSVLCGTGSGSL